jgi:hypothetical protein
MRVDWTNLAQQVDGVMTQDRHRLMRRLRDIEKLARLQQDYASPLQKWQNQVAQ